MYRYDQLLCCVFDIHPSFSLVMRCLLSLVRSHSSLATSSLAILRLWFPLCMASSYPLLWLKWERTCYSKPSCEILSLISRTHLPLQVRPEELFLCEGAGSWLCAAAGRVPLSQTPSSCPRGAAQGLLGCRTATLCHWVYALLGKGHLHLPQGNATGHCSLQRGMVRICSPCPVCCTPSYQHTLTPQHAGTLYFRLLLACVMG